jgi:hypothetical protein
MPKNHHNQGQEDASNGKNERPHSHTEEFFTYDRDKLRDLHEDNRQYQEGRNHHNSQK